MSQIRRRQITNGDGNLCVDIIHPNATYIKTKASFSSENAFSGNYFNTGVSEVIMDGETKSPSEVFSSFNPLKFINGGEHEYYIFRNSGWATTNGYIYISSDVANHIDILRPDIYSTNGIQGALAGVELMMIPSGTNDLTKPVSYPKDIYIPRGNTNYSSINANFVEVDFNIIED